MATPNTGDVTDVLEIPPEVWIEILKSDVLDAKDICNVSLVCRQMNAISSSNDIWKAKAHQRWPKQFPFVPTEGWRAIYKTRKHVQKTVEQCMKEIAEKNYDSEIVSNEHYDKLVKAAELHDKALSFIIEDLFAILETPRHKRLTDKFFARQAVKFMQQLYLKGELQAFFSLPPDLQHLEIEARYVSWWMQAAKRPDHLDMTAELDSIADKVRTVLRSHCTGSIVHPACDKDNSISGFTENLWSRDQNRQVLEAVNKVLYKDLALQGNNDNYYDMENSFVERVLERKKGIPITLSIIYQAVAKRLGVVCEPINFPNHFLLACRQKTLSGAAEEVIYIDAFNKGRQLTSEECMSTLLSGRQYTESFFEPATPHTVLERMARNLVCLMSSNARSEETIPVFYDAVTMFLAISADDMQMILVYTNLCVHLNINLPEVIHRLRSCEFGMMHGEAMLQQCERQLRRMREREVKKAVKVRSSNPGVEFSVGMIMKHKKYHYTCVIYGWDPECKASPQWIQQMGVHRLPNQQYQPFYNVLVEDGSNRYAAQENLLYTREVREITHSDVGRYFQEFTGRGYIPNSNLLSEYPEDVETTERLVDRFFASDQ